ncbi:MAG: class I SAM-dependent methyltransferase [Chitinophagaceae bacterium]|nr:class I SAM-dependent methyltransferase [Chitinophagaceae bacterium]
MYDNYICCMSGQTWYQEWFDTEYYHTLYFHRDEKEARLFIEKLVDYLKPEPHSRMLDTGCGRGRHSKILASMGFYVTGIDLSPSSIQIAKQSETENLEFFIHDIRQPFRCNYYHYVFNFFTSFGYFKTQREHDDAMSTLAKALLPEGILVIDYLNVHYAENHMIFHETKKIENITYEITRWHDASHFYKKIKVTDSKKNFCKEYTEKVAKFSLGDFNDMLSYQGMQIREVFGNYALEPYHTQHSPRLILIASRRFKDDYS